MPLKYLCHHHHIKSINQFPRERKPKRNEHILEKKQTRNKFANSKLDAPRILTPKHLWDRDNCWTKCANGSSKDFMAYHIFPKILPKRNLTKKVYIKNIGNLKRRSIQNASTVFSPKCPPPFLLTSGFDKVYATNTPTKKEYKTQLFCRYFCGSRSNIKIAILAIKEKICLSLRKTKSLATMQSKWSPFSFSFCSAAKTVFFSPAF